MPHNPILEEIYATRERLLAACKGDMHAYVEAARRRTFASGRKIAEIPPRQSQSKRDPAPSSQ